MTIGNASEPANIPIYACLIKQQARVALIGNTLRESGFIWAGILFSGRLKGKKYFYVQPHLIAVYVL